MVYLFHSSQATQMSHFIVYIDLCIFTIFLLSHKASCIDSYYEACVPRYCGGHHITYPFYIQGLQESYCGYPGIQLTCTNYTYPVLHIPDNDYIIQEINYTSRSLRVYNAAVLSPHQSGCFPLVRNISLEPDIFGFGRVSNLTLLSNCSELTDELSKYKTGCGGGGGGWDLAMVANDTDLSDALGVCNTSTVAPVDLVDGDVGGDQYEELLTRGFMLNWKAGDCSVCENSGGRCGFEKSSYHFKCFCPDRPHFRRCLTRNRGRPRYAIAFSVAGFVIFVTIVAGFIWRSALSKLMVWRKKENYHNVEDFLKSCGTLAPKRYSYSDLKKITNFFRVKLGQGGYGCVYKGKLSNGSLVAVKVLNESKGGEEFINEVASISRTSHVNIVSLLGFSFEGHKKALIYEFMPHGSLEKFIYKESSLTDHQLGWESLFQIAVGTARGLEYLHRGCNTRILHFDIKPHNILLDEDFCPKISDFGLAKLCSRKQSIVSLLNARGTIGYIAPEVFCRNFGGVSHKSDVYSYGMMVLEMVGGRNKIRPEVDGSSEMYFPDWIYNQLELDELGAHNGITSEEENEMARKMVIVSVWCIQTVPSSRPSMTRVVEMLEGSIQSLQIPPKPVLSSPPRSREDSSAIQSSSMAIL